MSVIGDNTCPANASISNDSVEEVLVLLSLLLELPGRGIEERLGREEKRRKDGTQERERIDGAFGSGIRR